MDQESVEMKLPLRLEQRRGRVFQQLLFMLVWSGFIVFWAMQFVPEFLEDNGLLSMNELNAEHWILLIPLGMLLVGLYSLFRIGVQLLPGNDFVHVIVDRDGLRRRHFGTRQEIRWNDIRRISVIHRKAGKSTRRVLLVEGNNDKPVREDESARYTAASFAFDLDNFLPAFANQEKLDKVSAWFNTLLHQARDGTFPNSTRVPGPLVQSVRPLSAAGMRQTATEKPARRGSVIER